LSFFLKGHPTKQIKILEVGFGTGLNALLTLQQHPDIQIQYTTLEPYPLPAEIFKQLNYTGKDELLALHACDWNSTQEISDNFTLTKFQATLEQSQLPENFFDVIYFDAFAPSSQPELWTQQAFSKIRDVMTRASVFVTYCAKGQVKRDLKSVGFVVESVPGPPGKREMVRAIKLA
jgi:tRNA U34 5-methylaminomethyl-2-thiouridine-forming methyltransferase MnmC